MPSVGERRRQVPQVREHVPAATFDPEFIRLHQSPPRRRSWRSVARNYSGFTIPQTTASRCIRSGLRRARRLRGQPVASATASCTAPTASTWREIRCARGGVLHRVPPENPKRCPSAPFLSAAPSGPPNRRPPRLQSSVPASGRWVAVPSRLPRPATGPPVDFAAAAAAGAPSRRRPRHSDPSTTLPPAMQVRQRATPCGDP